MPIFGVGRSMPSPFHKSVYMPFVQGSDVLLSSLIYLLHPLVCKGYSGKVKIFLKMADILGI